MSVPEGCVGRRQCSVGGNGGDELQTSRFQLVGEVFDGGGEGNYCASVCHGYSG